MPNRAYYSRRTGQNPDVLRLDLPRFKDLFLASYRDLRDKGYFAAAFGQDCQDGWIQGHAGKDVERFMFQRTRKKNLWPISDKIEPYSEEDLFDVIEFLFDHVAEPQKTWSHGYDNACVHYDEFDQTVGRSRFREDINVLLNDYATGFEMTPNGEILSRDRGYETLLDAKMPPSTDPMNVATRVEEAVRKFRRHSASRTDKREAVRLLADVLEYQRPKLKQILTSKDEADLFNIANNFGIRHHNSKQKTNYDQDVWLRWIFYFYLSTVHAAERLLNKGKPASHS
jgi:hypothetical protein